MKNYIEIPKIFLCSETGKPIEHCMLCSRFLLADGTLYFIEKSVRQCAELNAKEVIFEYAICLQCSIKMNASISAKSRRRISEYLSKHGRFEERRINLMQQDEPDPERWIDRCLVRDTPIAGTEEYQLVAQFEGRNMLLHDMPFALSREAIDELTHLLSARSLGEMDDFLGKYFSGPPELASLLRKRPPVLV